MQIVIFFIAVTSLVAILFYARYGGFRKVVFTEKKAGGEILVYEPVKGDYRLSAAVMDKIYYSLLRQHGVNTFKGFGIYYDNPKQTDKSMLRSDAGCILEPADSLKIAKLEFSFQVKQLPEKEYIVTEFPYIGRLSVFTGIMRVYPALSKYVRMNGYDEGGFVMEIYDTPGKKIIYRKELIRRK